MGSVPQWLAQAFRHSLVQAGSPLTSDELTQACQRLVDVWSDPRRTFHGISHVTSMLTLLEQLITEARDPALVRLTTWYHGVVIDLPKSDGSDWDPSRHLGENKAASATFAETDLLRLGVDPAKAKRVGTIIRALDTRATHNSAPSADPHAHVTLTGTHAAVDADIMVIRDAHLGTLTADPQAYKRYVALVRDEYVGVPEKTFLIARLNFAQRMLNRPHLFDSPTAAAWETPARQNLVAESERISARLAHLAEAEPHMDSADPHSTTEHRSTAVPQLHQVQTAFTPHDTHASAGTVPPRTEGSSTYTESSEGTRRTHARYESEPRHDSGSHQPTSSLESAAGRIDDEPGAPIESLTPEQRKARRRAEIARSVMAKISAKHVAAGMARSAVERAKLAEQHATAREATQLAQAAQRAAEQNLSRQTPGEESRTLEAEALVEDGSHPEYLHPEHLHSEDAARTDAEGRSQLFGEDDPDVLASDDPEAGATHGMEREPDTD
ncbi:MAG: hypothetical protein PUG30_03425 [Actinomycetaceae bacterium]|nr:hypothetical protein [Actinomycetaceae bacterium]